MTKNTGSMLSTDYCILLLHSAAADGVGSIMADNVARLDERGERLRKMQDKTAALESDAADFATMARKLAEQSANKKWWQM